MKKIENSFAVTGFIGKDAEIRSFETASVARFSIVVSRIGKINEEKTFVSSVMKVEAWSKMEDRYAFWILQKDVLITVEGYFKPEEWTDSKSGEKRNRIVMVATKFDSGKIRTPGLKRKSNQTIEAAQGRFNRLLMRQKIIKKVFLNLVIFRFIGIFVSKMIPKYVFL